jgi:hypothetical protein
MKLKLFSSIIICFLFMLPATTRAQYNNYIHSNASIAEKIYLQSDGKVYTTGNIIWFKCIVSSAYNHVPSTLSSVLYVELITPDETIYEKKLIKIENGIGEGFFNLDKNLQQGLYLIRAYTQWNKNFGTDFFFEEYIQVFAQNDEEKMPISNVTLIKEQTNANRLEACFNPLEIDSLHKSNLTVFITLDNKKDTLSIKRGIDKKYRIDYPINIESQFVTLQMQTANQQKYSKTIVLNEEYLDLQFFPESGELVHGLPSKVGFKALDANGQGKMVQGDIVDGKDSVIASFKSNLAGMGSFVMDNADSTKTYFARMTSQSTDNQILLYPLPRVASVGNTLSVAKQGENILVTARSNYIRNDSICMRFSLRGMSFYEMKVLLMDSALEFSVPRNQLPEGIISFTMFDNRMQTIAERLYFHERPESRINIALSTDKDIYAKRELSRLDIQTCDSNGTPVKAKLSLLVINKQQMGKMQNMRQNILSWFLLDSELKGEIENPGFYFNNDSSMYNDLDALMLTQGWRKYNYAKPYNELTFKPEPSLTVSGHASGVLLTKKRKEAKLVMFTYGKSKNAYSQVTDSLGNFKFILDDEYGQKMNVLIQSSKNSGEIKNYTISLDKNDSPTVNYNHLKKVEEIDSVVLAYVEKKEELRKIDEAFPLDSGNILIEEVEVKAYKLTPARKLVMKQYGEPEVVIDGKAILEKEEKWSYGLYSVLMFNFPGQVRIFDTGNGDLYANVIGSEATLVIIDGIPLKLHDYQSIPYIPPIEVSSFEIIRCATGFNNLFAEVFGYYPDPPFLCGSIIAIYTKAGKGILGAYKAEGFVKATVPIFSAPREFYAPKYENPQSDNMIKPDLRALIHWEPILKTDSLGNASASFYNADNIGKMIVVVEAISEKGEIGYQKIEYEIEGKEKEFIIVK